MKDSTKRILLIGGSLLILGGVAYYFLVYRPAHPKGDDTGDQNNLGGGDELPPDETITDQTATTNTSTIPSELNSADKIKAFQDWMDTQGPWVKGSDGKYKLLNKGNGYGTFGPSTSAAWSYYKSAYLAKPKIDTNTVSSDPALKNAIDFIISKWAGDKNAIRKRLLSEEPNFVKAWSDAIQKWLNNQLPKNAFLYSNKVYDVVNGKKRLSFNPIGKTGKASQNTTLRELSSAGSPGTNILAEKNLHEIADYRWNPRENLMFLYVPNNGYTTRYKWIYSGHVKFD